MVTVKKRFAVNEQIIDHNNFVDYLLSINESKVIDIHEGQNLVGKLSVQILDGEKNYLAEHNGDNAISSFLRRLRPEVPVLVRKSKNASFA
jgi:hypothetical protein